MRSAQILALTGLAAAQSTTIIVTNGISTTVVLPNWDVSGGAVTIAVPTGASVDVSVALPDTTTTLVVDQTEVVGTVTETSVPTSFGKLPQLAVYYPEKGLLS
jgi:hypothetical protein